MDCGVDGVVKWTCGVLERCGSMSVSLQKLFFHFVRSMSMLKNCYSSFSIHFHLFEKNVFFRSMFIFKLFFVFLWEN